MPYEGIPEDQLESEERALLPAARQRDATEEILRSLPEVTVFGLLLVSDPNHPLVRVIRNRWSELHHLTGRTIALVAFQPPATWAPSLEDYWRQQLGSSFDRVWADWHSGRGLEPGAAFDYLDLIEDPKLTPSQLPCLALFADLNDREAVVRPLPSWDEASLFKLLENILQTVRECGEKAPEERLNCLRKELTSPKARALASLGHYTDQASDYLREHPALVVTTTISFVLALATGNVLPLSPALIGTLKAVKGIFAKKLFLFPL